MRALRLLVACLLLVASFPAHARVANIGKRDPGSLGGVLGPSGTDCTLFDEHGVQGCTRTDDTVPDAVKASAQNAYAAAAVNQDGAGYHLAGGFGAKKITIDNYADGTCPGSTLTATIAKGDALTASACTKTEGVDWTAATSNAATCNSAAVALNACDGITAVCVGADVLMTADATTNYVQVARSGATCATAYNNSDGRIRAWQDVMLTERLELGPNQEFTLKWETVTQANPTALIGVNGGNRCVVLIEADSADYATDWSCFPFAHPSFNIQSADHSDTADFVSMWHDTVRGHLDVGNGQLAIDSGLLLPDGSLAVPAVGWLNDDDGTGTGLYRYSANTIAQTSNGVQVWRANSNAFTLSKPLNAGTTYLYSASQILELGGGMVSAWGNGTGDVGVAGNLELVGDFYSLTDMLTGTSGGNGIAWGPAWSGADTSWLFRSTAQSNSTMMLALNSAARTLILNEAVSPDFVSTDYLIPAQTDATIALQASDQSNVYNGLLLNVSGLNSRTTSATVATVGLNLGTGAQTNAGDYDSGDVNISTGATTTDGDTGDIVFQTGAAGAGDADAGSLVFKTHGNNERMKIAGDGAITVADYTKHYDFLPNALTVIGVGAPDTVCCGTPCGFGLDNVNEELYAVAEITGEWNATSDMTLRIHTVPSDSDPIADTEDVDIDVEWRSTDPDSETGKTGSAATTTITHTQSGAGAECEYNILEATLPYATGNQPLATGDNLTVQLLRNPGTESNSYSGNIIIYKVEIEYTANKLSSH